MRWVAQFVLLSPPSASIQKAVMSVGAPKVTEETEFTVLVREWLMQEGRGKPWRITKHHGCGGPRKDRL